MKRRRFSALLGGVAAAAWPVAGEAQSKPMAVIGWLYMGKPEAIAGFLPAFREGLAESGYAEGRNVTIEYRWAYDDHDRLPALVNDLIARKVDAIATIGTTPWAAKRATTTIPIVFGTGGDPVATGFVSSLARPEGNLTGVSYLVADLGTKRLDLMTQLVPQARRIALLINPQNANTEHGVREMRAAAEPRGLQLVAVPATTEGEVDRAFATMASQGCGAVVIQADPFIHSQRGQLLALAGRHRLPAIYTWRDFAEEGGLIAYGPSLKAVYRQIGVYAGRILKGAKPSDLPIVQPTTFELVVNLKTARTLGLTLPPALLALADEIIE
jgi:putative tryptophan/tyrosine transport system substrate-binding protein